MRPTFLLTALSCAVLACQPTPAKLSDADLAAIRAAATSFAENGLARRDSANAAQYAENAVFMPPNQPAVEGRAAIRAWLAAFPPMSAFSLTSIEIDGQGDLAYERGTYAFTIAAAGKAPAMEDHGKYLAVRRRQADGSWLMTLDMFNSDVPLPSR
jgi:ketosteroid isomerase-like protein